MGAFTSRSFRQLLRQKGPFDLIDSHFIYPDGYAALELSRKFHLPLVVSARGSDINVYSQIDGIREKIQLVLKNADAIVGVSKDLVRKMIVLGAPPDRCHVIPNGVDMIRFHPADRMTEGRAAQQLIAVGNLVPEKGFAGLLKAISLLRKSYPEIKLDIVGSGHEQENLSNDCVRLGIDKQVRFLGQIPHEKIHTLFQRAEAFCLASLREGNPNVVMEALATGLPVAATPVGGVPELIIDGINGFLAKDYRPESIADAIARTLEQKWSPYQIRETLAGRIWQKVADEVQSVFEKVLSKR